MRQEEAIARALLGADRIRYVRTEPGLNEDGVAVLRIHVVYESSKGDPSVEEMARVSEEIWKEVLASDSNAYPVTSFISSEDMESLNAA